MKPGPSWTLLCQRIAHHRDDTLCLTTPGEHNRTLYWGENDDEDTNAEVTELLCAVCGRPILHVKVTERLQRREPPKQYLKPVKFEILYGEAVPVEFEIGWTDEKPELWNRKNTLYTPKQFRDKYGEQYWNRRHRRGA